MTRVDFHSNVPDRIAYACRLIRKARANRCQVVVMAADSAQMQTLDEALWTFAEQEFLPHVAAGDVLAAQTPSAP
jgi:DNA polymerase-3 subunit chi